MGRKAALQGRCRSRRASRSSRRCSAIARAPAPSANTEDIIAPIDPAQRQVDSGWQAGTCTKNRPTARSCARSPRPTSSSKRPPATRRWASPSSSSSTRPSGRCETPVGELKTVRVDLPVGLSVNPRATDSARWRPSKRAPAAARPDSQGRRKPRHRVARRRRHRRPSAADPVPVYNVDPANRRAGPLRPRTRRQRSLPARRRRLGRRLPRGIHDRRPATDRSPDRCSEASSSKTASSSTAAPATAPSSPRPAPASARKRSPAHEARLLDLAARQLDEQKRKNRGYDFPAERRAAPSSRRFRRETNRKNASTIPYEPSIGVDPNTAETDSPSGRAHRRRRARIITGGGERRRRSHTKEAQGDAAGRDGPQPLGRNGLWPAPTPSSARARETRSPARPRRRSAP